MTQPVYRDVNERLFLTDSIADAVAYCRHFRIINEFAISRYSLFMAYITALEAITGIRQGLAVLMASAVLVLKHEISTLRQSHNFTSIDFKFGVGNKCTAFQQPYQVW